MDKKLSNKDNLAVEKEIKRLTGILAAKLYLDLENPNGYKKLTKEQEDAIMLAGKFDRPELDKMLFYALDNEDTDQVNLLLDAIQVQNKCDELVAAIPIDQFEEIVNYAMDYLDEQDKNTRTNDS